MTSLLPVEGPEFQEAFDTARYGIFRLETLQWYLSPGEVAPLEAFLAGGSYLPTERKQSWTEIIRGRAMVGCPMRRVHVVTQPLSDYVRYELTWGYAANVEAGEDIRIIEVPAGEQWPEDVSGPDFWLFDSHRLFDMHYDPVGDLLGVEPVADPTRVVAANRTRDAALHWAVPWSAWIATHPELARLVPA